MDFSIPPATETLLAKIRDFMECEVYPLEEEARGKGFRALLPRLEEARGRVRELGLWAPQVPTEYGGLGLGFMEHALVREELGRSPYGMFVFSAQAPDAGNMEILSQFGTEAQKERWLRPLTAGEFRSCFAMTEPEHAGSNPVWMSTTAVRDGDDYVINGHKWFTTGADGAAFGPAVPEWTYTAETKTDFYSHFISGTQRLPNGNTLICSGANGTLFEVTREGKTVWKYINPIAPAAPEQGDQGGRRGPGGGGRRNGIFKVRRYAPDFAGLVGRDLTPGPTVAQWLADNPDSVRQPDGPGPRGPAGPGGGFRPPFMPLMFALDSDRDGELSARPWFWVQDLSIPGFYLPICMPMGDSLT